MSRPTPGVLRLPNLLLYHLVYASRCCASLGPAEVRLLASESSQKNWSADVTGSLLFTGDHFLQWLEGPAEAVNTLAERIRQDRRHRNFTVLQSGMQTGRRFATWGMRYLYDLSLDDALAAAIVRHDDALDSVLAEALLRPSLDDLNPSLSSGHG